MAKLVSSIVIVRQRIRSKLMLKTCFSLRVGPWLNFSTVEISIFLKLGKKVFQLVWENFEGQLDF